MLYPMLPDDARVYIFPIGQIPNEKMFAWYIPCSIMVLCR